MVGRGASVCCCNVGLGSGVKAAVGKLRVGVGVATKVPACKVCC